jgi:hypothetical protein
MSGHRAGYGSPRAPRALWLVSTSLHVVRYPIDRVLSFVYYDHILIVGSVGTRQSPGPLGGLYVAMSAWTKTSETPIRRYKVVYMCG